MCDGVQEFYSGQTVFVTGATGFLGRAIVEKLLRTCPDVKKIYLLIRTKKGKDSIERINKLFDHPFFERMKKENPTYRDKVDVIAGDLSIQDIGISESDRKILTDEMTVVFHAGATVKFDELLKTTVNINISATKEILKLCSNCNNLKAFVYISTAYANCNRDEVDEIVYPPPIKGDNIINLARCMPDEIMERCTSLLIQGWPNTYVFSKQIVEDFIKSEANNNKIPAAIFRPAIVVGAYDEPIPGFCDNFNGITGFIAAVGAGLLRAGLVDYDLRTEIVPVDMTVNGALAVAWDVACNYRNGASECGTPNDNLPVYNYVTSKDNQLTWEKCYNYVYRYGYKTPSAKAVWYTHAFVTKYKYLFYLYNFFLHLLPALLIDLICIITGRKPQALRVYKKMHKSVGLLTYFSVREWKFQNDNMKKLWMKLSEKDKKCFNFNMSSINWDLFFRNKISAMRVYLFHETPDTIPAARRRMLRLYILHIMTQIILGSLFLWLFWTPISILYNLFIDHYFSSIRA